jgi:RNA polymerase sigma-70 factor (ECF subfamily)
MTQNLFDKSLQEITPTLNQHAKQLTRNREDARDLVQDTLYKALKYRSSYVTEANFGGWIYTIMKNTFLNNVRRAALVRFTSDSDPPGIFNMASQTANNTSVEIHTKELELSILALPDGVRIPFTMSVAGFQYDEIAEEMLIPVGTVKSRINRARTLLARDLRDSFLS